jgi:dipeptidase D
VTRTTQSGHKFAITITGLCGGHSGCEIDKEHGNADILMGRVLKGVFDETPFGILTLAGGQKDNAIPRMCTAEILVPEESVGVVTEIIEKLGNAFSHEFYSSDREVTLILEDGGSATEEILDYGSVNKVIYYLRSVQNGVLHMSQELPGLVETSLNLGIMELREEELYLVTSIRSSVGTRKDDLCDRVISLVEMLGGEADIEGDYPAWEYKPESSLRPQIAAAYEKQYGKEPVFTTIHAGLECGLLSQKIADLDCVSFGPDILDIHTPKERLSIASTGRVWDFLVEFLRQAK